jgi:uncharacterized protein YukE
MAQIGAEMEQLQQLQQVFQQKAAAIDELKSAIDGQVGGTWWVGPAADRFRDQWNGSFKPNLTQLQQALTEASAEVQRRHAALQAAGT